MTLVDEQNLTAQKRNLLYANDKHMYNTADVLNRWNTALVDFAEELTILNKPINRI